MKNESKHTKGEWKFNFHPLKHEGVMIVPSNGAIIAPTDKKIFGRDPGKVICYMTHEREETEQAEMKANAERIVKAVNMHDELIEALEAIRARIDGEFDNPALISYGLLGVGLDMDIRNMATHMLNKNEQNH